MSDKVFNIIIKLLKQGGADTEVIKGLTDIKTAMTQGMAIAGTFTTAYFAVDRILKETVDVFVSYADEVRNLSQLNGTSAESTSRLIQLTDDYKISVSDLTATQRELLANGKTMSVEFLANVADQYNNATTQAEKNKVASDNLGKSWKSYIELLKQGGTAIKEQSAAQQGALILTQDAIDKARELEKAQDGLNDATLALKVSVGELLTPLETNLVTALYQLITITTEGTYGSSALTAALFSEGNAANQAADAHYNHGAALLAASAAATTAEEQFRASLKSISGSMLDVGVAALQMQLSMDGNFSTEDQQKVLDFKLQLGLLTQQEYDTATSALAMKTAIDALLASGGTVTTDWIMNYYEHHYISEVNASKTMGPYQPSSSGGAAGDEYSAAGYGTRNGVVLHHRHLDPDGTYSYSASHGADFVVPPQFTNDSLRLNVSAGEKVKVTPAGMVSNDQAQTARLADEIRLMRNAIDDLPSKFAAEIQKRM